MAAIAILIQALKDDDQPEPAEQARPTIPMPNGEEPLGGNSRPQRKVDSRLAHEGASMLREIWDNAAESHGLHGFYKTPEPQDGTLHVHIPQESWNQLTQEQRRAVAHYAASLAGRTRSSWDIVVGRLRGGDILYDHVAVNSGHWNLSVERYEDWSW